MISAIVMFLSPFFGAWLHWKYMPEFGGITPKIIITESVIMIIGIAAYVLLQWTINRKPMSNHTFAVLGKIIVWTVFDVLFVPALIGLIYSICFKETNEWNDRKTAGLITLLLCIATQVNLVVKIIIGLVMIWIILSGTANAEKERRVYAGINKYEGMKDMLDNYQRTGEFPWMRR